jgi:YMGG-like Gly-zipper
MKKLFCVLSLAFGLTLFTGNALHAQHVKKDEYKVKHPWSHKKKDALIGAGVGAVAGAVVGHGAKGAVIGGAAGGGAGYLYGRHRDKKYGNPKNTVVYRHKRKYE